MKLHFQVVIMDRQDYILEYRNFKWHDIELMLQYLEQWMTNGEAQNIRITRWNDQNERA